MALLILTVTPNPAYAVGHEAPAPEQARVHRGAASTHALISQDDS